MWSGPNNNVKKKNSMSVVGHGRTALGQCQMGCVPHNRAARVTSPNSLTRSGYEG